MNSQSLSASPVETAPAASSVCQQTIGNNQAIKREFRGRGFGRREVLIFCCPSCKADRVLRINWHGPTPPGGFRCGALIPATVAS